jgi:RNA polymerase sigma factor (sigma-70 family)
MTAVPDWDIGSTGTDAELARAAAGGDRRAFAGIYDRYADRLHDFCVGMLRDYDAAADCVQDTFCVAATRLPQLREPDKLRSWLYAIARNEALRRLRERRRETPSDELPDAMSHEPGPDTLAARSELADLVAEAAGGLSDRDNAVLELAYRHGLDGPELADALGVSPGNANKIVYRLRETIELSLGALLVSRRARNTPDGCPELAAILDNWDGRFTVLMRKRVARHIESCPACDEERRRLVSPVALLGAVPVFIPAPTWLRERTLNEIQLDSLASSMASDNVDHVRGNRSRSMLLPLVLFAVALIAALGLAIVWLYQQSTPITPIEVSAPAPTPISTPAAPTPSSPVPAPPAASVVTTVPTVSAPPDQLTPQEQQPFTPAPPPPPPPPAPTPVTPDKPVIGGSQTPATRAPISVAPEPQSPPVTATPGDSHKRGRAGR